MYCFIRSLTILSSLSFALYRGVSFWTHSPDTKIVPLVLWRPNWTKSPIKNIWLFFFSFCCGTALQYFHLIPYFLAVCSTAYYFSISKIQFHREVWIDMQFIKWLFISCPALVSVLGISGATFSFLLFCFYKSCLRLEALRNTSCLLRLMMCKMQSELTSV